MSLTKLGIKTAKPGLKTRRLFDGGGLYLEISPSGGKWWRYKYRHGGKEKRISLGVYPKVDLLQARASHLEARKLLDKGFDSADRADRGQAAVAPRHARRARVRRARARLAASVVAAQ